MMVTGVLRFVLGAIRFVLGLTILAIGGAVFVAIFMVSALTVVGLLLFPVTGRGPLLIMWVGVWLAFGPARARRLRVWFEHRFGRKRRELQVLREQWLAEERERLTGASGARAASVSLQ
ncbi:MAG: hypothetical protein ACRDXD_12160 [Acidimicrobiia bacterium]